MIFSVFFSGSVEFCSGSNLLLRGLTSCFFLSSFLLLTGRQTSLSNSKNKWKCHEKRDRPLISKIEINYQISPKQKIYPLIEFSEIGSKMCQS